MSAAKLLWKEFKDVTHPKTGLKQIRVDLPDDNIFMWNVTLLVVDPESIYNGSYLTGTLNFPKNYPYSPPSFRFTPAIFHPNVYMDGRLCISILHQANQEANDEPANLTWSPAQNVESVLLSIISLLDDPNIGSPANVEAGIAYRKAKESYIERVAKDVARSKERIPSGFIMPTLDELSQQKEENEDLDQQDDWDDGFFYDDDEDDEEEEEDDEEDEYMEDSE